MKWLKLAAKKSPQNFLACQSPLQQSLDDLQQGLQPMVVSPSHTILPVGMGGETSTHKRVEQRVDVVPQVRTMLSAIRPEGQ
jgi:hypothetical protein